MPLYHYSPRGRESRSIIPIIEQAQRHLWSRTCKSLCSHQLENRPDKSPSLQGRAPSPLRLPPAVLPARLLFASSIVLSGVGVLKELDTSTSDNCNFQTTIQSFLPKCGPRKTGAWLCSHPTTWEGKKVLQNIAIRIFPFKACWKLVQDTQTPSGLMKVEAAFGQPSGNPPI